MPGSPLRKRRQNNRTDRSQKGDGQFQQVQMRSTGIRLTVAGQGNGLPDAQYLGWQIMETMPFTLAHAAAAWPFRRTRLIPSAVVVGTFAPDFEYFARLTPGGHFGHTLAGMFLLDLPLSLVVLWLFHAFMKEPIVGLLPFAIQSRMRQDRGRFRFRGPGRLAMIAVSILIGVGTHILWDSFTHADYWLYQHWRLMSETVRLPIVGDVFYYKLFQHGSTVAGSAILVIWFLNWYRNASPQPRVSPTPLSLSKKRGLIVSLVLIALCGALIRSFVSLAGPANARVPEIVLGNAVVTAITLIWLQLLAYGIIRSKKRQQRDQG